MMDEEMMDEETMNQKENYYATAFKLAWPAILESFFIALAGLIDSYMVSSMGPNEVAAVGLTTQPKFISLAVFMAISISVSALVARRKGEGKQDEANRILSTALGMGVCLAIVSSILFISLAPPIIRFCGSTVETHESAVIYYRILCAGLIFNAFQLIINASQRGSGNTKISMTTNMTSSAVNIVFNYLLIGGHFGFPALGITGAAIATVLGTFVASVMSILSIIRKDSYLQLKMIIGEKLYPAMKELKSIIHLGYSIFLEQLLLRTGFLATAIMAAKQGPQAMAAHQVGMNIMGLSFSFGDGLQAAAVALIGYNLGQNKPEIAKIYGKTCQKIGLAISVVLAMVYFFGGRLLMTMFFKNDPQIVEIGTGITRIIIIVVIFQIQQVIYMGCLRGAGDTLYTAAVGTFSVTLVRTAGSYICCYILGLGIIGIWCGVIADQLSRYLFSYIRFKQGNWVKIKI